MKAAGYVFRTRSDTEFILHAYEHWGIDFVSRLRGMFAIAILDLRRRAVYVIRDRLGLKPVVYAHGDDGFAFASTTRALLPWLPREARAFSAEGIDAYLAHRTIPAPRTIFDNIRRLPPAHWLRYDLARGTLEAREYWRPEPSTEAWLPTLDAAIRMRTVADRPLGLFLSSGVDSSAIACRLAAMGFNRLQSFTAAFPDTPFDESALARAAADRLGFPNLAVTIPTRIADDFARLVADLDEPFADPSSVPTWYLARETTRHVKVVLGGDGGDELFGGYKRYAKHLRTRWRRGIVLPGMRAPAGIGGSGWQRVREELRLDWRAAYVLRFSGFTPGERAFFAPEAAPPAHYWRMPDSAATTLPALLEIDRLNYLPDYILRKADLCTMAHGLEMRAPLLDHRFVGAVVALPDAARFTTPPRRLLAPAMTALGDLDPVRAQEARLQSAARRLARERSGATNSGNGRPAREAVERPARCFANRPVRRYLEERKTWIRRAGAAAHPARRIADAARRARGAGRRRLSPAATGGETAPPAQDTGRQCDRAQNAGRAPPVSDRDRASARGA